MSDLLELESELEAEQAVDGGSAAISLALDGAKHDPALREHIGGFLSDQRALIADQRRQLHDQLATSRLKHWGERLKLTLQALTIFVGLLALGAVAALAWSAYNDRGLVVDGFGVPADLAAQGSTGAALATELHDKLAQLHDETSSPAKASEVREKSTSDVKVQIPETGVSLDEVNRVIRDWLGHETHITGEVSRVAAGPDKGGLALSIRVAGRPGKRFVQPDGDLEALLQKGAEQVYGAVEPALYAAWLAQHGRAPEALAVAHWMAEHGTPRERAMGYAGMVDGTQTPLERRRLMAMAIAADPSYGGGLNDFAVAESQLGHWQAALEGYSKAAAFGRSHSDPGMTPEGHALMLLLVEGNASGLRGAPSLDFPCREFGVSHCTPSALADAILGGSEGSRADGGGGGFRIPQAATQLARLHDLTNAQRLIEAPRADPAGRGEAFKANLESGWIHASANLHRGREDWAALLKDAEAWDALAAKWPFARYPSPAVTWRPLALAKLGDAAGALRAAQALPADCYPCTIARAETAEALGRRAEADRWYAEAVRQGPSLPQAEAGWAQALLARGDFAGAASKAEAASRKGPQFADPLVWWGEALLGTRDFAGAARRFAAADKLTPRWGRLHLKWGEALARQGKTADARAQFAQAAALDLTAPERAELAAQKP